MAALLWFMFFYEAGIAPVLHLLPEEDEWDHTFGIFCWPAAVTGWLLTDRVLPALSEESAAAL